MSNIAWDPTSPAFKVDPYPTYAALLEQEPLHKSPFGPLVISRYADCMTVFRHPAASSDFRKSPNWEVMTGKKPADVQMPFLLLDPPDHTRARNAVSRAFSPARTGRLRSRMVSLVDTVLDRALADGGMEVVSALAFPLPVMVICEMLGVPPDDVEMFRKWSAAGARSLDPEFTLPAEFAERARAADAEATAYFDDLIARRRRQPHDDLISDILNSDGTGGPLSAEEVNLTVRLLLDAGHETTVNLIANGVLAFGRHPDQWARLRDDPALVKGAVEEVLRFDPPVHINGRLALDDIQISCGTLPRQADIVMLPAAANRDPSQFERPGAFDIGRLNNHHLGFGFGAHHCIGAPLARLEGQVVFGRLAQRARAIILEQDPPPYKENITLRGVSALPVRLLPAP